MAIRKLSENTLVENLSVLPNLVGEISRNSEGEHLWNKDVYRTTLNHPTCKKKAFYIRDSRVFLGETSLEASHKISLPSIPAVDNPHTTPSGNGVIKRGKIRISRSREFFS